MVRRSRSLSSTFSAARSSRKPSNRPAVFLDRDGVLNRCPVVDGRPHSPASLEGFQLLPGVIEACARLKEAGMLLVVVTNQPDIGRGKQSRDVVDAMHQKLREALPIDAVHVCSHAYDGECECRKPRPGMLLAASSEMGIDLSRSFMVGDRWRDIDCGHTAGCKTVFIDHHYAEGLSEAPDWTAEHLSGAVNWILEQARLSDATLDSDTSSC